MAVFTYDEYVKYGSLIVQDIQANNSIKLGDNGKGFVIKKRGKIPEFKSPVAVTFDEKKFKSLFKKTDDQVIEALRRKNNEYLTDSVTGHQYRFTQIYKGEYSGQVKKISTKQQEQISLKIIEAIYSSSTKKYKTFAQMFDDKKSGINTIFPELRSNNEWWKHFELQFNQVDGISDLKSTSYDVYEYDVFMKYITDFVTKTNKWYTSKDSWNPADIWLIKKSKLDKYKDLIDESQSIKRVNRILKVAANRKHIVGVSLKKSDGKKLNFEWVNLTLREQKLPKVEFKELRFKTDYNKTTKTFESKTSTFRVEEGNNKFELSFRSNQSSLQNITYEFKKVGGSAQLGKVPKDQMSEWLNEQLLMKLPVATDLNETFDGKYWAHVVNIIDSSRSSLSFKYNFNKDEVLANIEDSYLEGLSIKNGIFLQMLEFVYILADYRKKSRNDLDEFATICFYFAQKKGQKYNFGPFGKLY